MKFWKRKRPRFFDFILVAMLSIQSSQVLSGSNVPYNQLKNCNCGKEVWNSYKNKKNQKDVELLIGVAQCQCPKENLPNGKTGLANNAESVRVFCNHKMGEIKKSFIECGQDPDVEVQPQIKKVPSAKKSNQTKDTNSK